MVREYHAGSDHMDAPLFWILDVAVEARVPLRWLVSDRIEEAFNRPSHGVPFDELVALLTTAHQYEYIAFERFVAPHIGDVPWNPTAHEIAAALRGEINAIYGMTPQGGSRWEAVAHPDWDRYVSVLYGPYDAADSDSDPMSIVETRSRPTIERYLNYQHYLWEAHILAETVHWQALKPWAATYWKSFPTGYRVTFDYTYQPCPQTLPEDVRVWMAQVRHWYTNPFGLPSAS